MMWCRWLILWMLCCGFGLPGVQARSVVVPVVLREATSLSLQGHLMQLHDPSGTRDVTEVASGQAGPWEPMDGRFSESFTQDAVWLCFEVQGADAPSAPWWLVVSNPLLEDVRFYSRDAQGHWLMQHAGTNVWRWDALAAYPESSFRIDPTPRSVSRYYLRIQTRTAMVSEFTLLPDRQLFRTMTENAWGAGLLLGMYVLIALLYIGLWLATRRAMNAWYAVYVALILGLTQTDMGWLQILLAGQTWFHSGITMWLGVVLAGMVGAEFFAHFLDLRHLYPRLRAVYLGTCRVLGACELCLLALGQPQMAMKLTQSAIVLVSLFVLGIAAELWRRGSAQGRFFVMAFGMFYIGVALRLARNLGWFDLGWISLHGYQIGTLVHVCLLSLGVFRRQKQWMHETEVARAQATEAARMQAASEMRLRQEQSMFMAMVSHEFRTPLGIIMATAGNLSGSTSLSDKDRMRSQKILRASQRLSSLLDNYLSVERLERAEASPRYAEVDMRALCRDAAAEFEEAAGRCIDMTLPAEPLVCDCDADLIRIALLNLLYNAHRHSPAPGSVHLLLRDLGGDVAVWVLDQGAGMSAEELPLIFQSYFRGRAAVGQPGSGLGLYLVKRIVTKHAGRVEARNRAGGGAEFCVVLPKQQAKVPVAA